jgi:hypothetical protein
MKNKDALALILLVLSHLAIALAVLSISACAVRYLSR